MRHRTPAAETCTTRIWLWLSFCQRARSRSPSKSVWAKNLGPVRGQDLSILTNEDGIAHAWTSFKASNHHIRQGIRRCASVQACIRCNITVRASACVWDVNGPQPSFLRGLYEICLVSTASNLCGQGCRLENLVLVDSGLAFLVVRHAELEQG